MSLNVKTIQPNGILDGTKAIAFRQEIDQVLENNADIILIDFQNITFMDSSGLGALVLARQAIEKEEAKLYLCSINDQIKILFELTGLDRVFAIFSNREEFDEKIIRN